MPASTYWRMTDLSRKLERERDEARAKLKWRMHWVETLRRVGRKLRKERDEAREAIETLEIRQAAIMMHTQTVVDEAMKERALADRLGDALDRAESHMRHGLNCYARVTDGELGCTCGMTTDNRIATESLTAWKEARK